MRVWALESTSRIRAGFYWIGEGTTYSNSVDDAVLFVREIDAKRILVDNGLLSAQVVAVTWPAPVPPLPTIAKELLDGDEPRGRSAADHQGDGGTVSSKEPC